MPAIRSAGMVRFKDRHADMHNGPGAMLLGRSQSGQDYHAANTSGGHPAGGLEAAIYAGFGQLVGDLLIREWPREDGAALKIGRLLIDANWGTSTNVIYEFSRQSASIIVPSHGRYVGASSMPFGEYKKRPGDRIGNHLACADGIRQARHAALAVRH